MSPRPKRLRKMSVMPVISGFKPYGGEAKSDKIFLHLEEYESLRLCDYAAMNHLDASRAMNVSRPTLTRIYAAARRKIAEALVEGKQVIIEGGKIYFDSEWYGCSSCGCYFNHHQKGHQPSACPLCGSLAIENFEDSSNSTFEPAKSSDQCFCSECGAIQPHEPGKPCRQMLCHICGSKMVRRLHQNH